MSLFRNKVKDTFEREIREDLWDFTDVWKHPWGDCLLPVSLKQSVWSVDIPNVFLQDFTVTWESGDTVLSLASPGSP